MLKHLDRIIQHEAVGGALLALAGLVILAALFFFNVPVR